MTARYCPSSYDGDGDALNNRRWSTVPSSVLSSFSMTRRLGSLLVMILWISCCSLLLLLLIQCNIYVNRLWIFPVINGMSGMPETAEHHRPPQTSSKEMLGKLQTTEDHPRTVRKTAGHTAEHGGAGSKTQNKHCTCIFRVNVRQISIACTLHPNYIQTNIVTYLTCNSIQKI